MDLWSYKLTQLKLSGSRNGSSLTRFIMLASCQDLILPMLLHQSRANLKCIFSSLIRISCDRAENLPIKIICIIIIIFLFTLPPPVKIGPFHRKLRDVTVLTVDYWKPSIRVSKTARLRVRYPMLDKTFHCELCGLQIYVQFRHCCDVVSIS
jgi:hypothetical protein